MIEINYMFGLISPGSNDMITTIGLLYSRSQKRDHFDPGLCVLKLHEPDCEKKKRPGSS